MNTQNSGRIKSGSIYVGSPATGFIGGYVAHKTKLDLLTKIGLAKNYTPSPQYWKILDRLMKAEGRVR